MQHVKKIAHFKNPSWRFLVLFCSSSFFFPVACAAVVGEHNAAPFSFFLWLLNRHPLCHIKHSVSVQSVFLGNGRVFSSGCHAVVLLLHCANQSPTEAERAGERKAEQTRSPPSPPPTHIQTHRHRKCTKTHLSAVVDSAETLTFKSPASASFVCTCGHIGRS